MKTGRYILSIIIMCMMTISCSAQKIFSEVSSMKGVTSIYIGPTMLKIAGASIDIGRTQDAIDLKKLTKGLSSIEIVQSDNAMSKEMEKVCQRILSPYPFEIVTEVSEGNQNVEISSVMNEDGKTMDMMLITVKEKNELVYILLKGKIDAETLFEAITVD